MDKIFVVPFFDSHCSRTSIGTVHRHRCTAAVSGGDYFNEEKKS